MRVFGLIRRGYLGRLGGQGGYCASPCVYEAPVDQEFLASVLNAYVRQCDLGAALGVSFQMKTGLDLLGCVPDLVFVAKEYFDRFKETHPEGPAVDLLFEITSSESCLRDCGEKIVEYELGGVREY
ncbi:MAG: Uma2 family endonuclease [Thermosphaera sp.]